MSDIFPAVARVYAKALFEMAEEQNLQSLAEDLQLLTFIASDAKVQSMLHDPRNNAEIFINLFAKASGAQWNAMMKNLITLLSENKRLRYLPEIFEQFQLLQKQKLKQKTARIETAYPLSSEQKVNLSKALSKRFDATIILEEVSDKKIMGGAIIRIDDSVIDASALGQLKSLADELQVKELL